MAKTSKGIMAIPTEQNVSKVKINVERVFATNFLALPLLCICFLNKGMKAALNAPSAKNLLKMLGRAKAIMNASPIGPEPKNAASKMSLQNPNTRLMNVQIPTVKKFLIICDENIILFSQKISLN